MMKKSEIAYNRRTRVLHIINSQFEGNKTKFALKLSENSGKHIAVTIVHRWFWDNEQQRNIGESHARLIEDAFGLEYAWLDGFTNATLQTSEQINDPRMEYLVKKTKPAKLAPVISWEQIDDLNKLDEADITEWVAQPAGSDNAYFLKITGEAMLSHDSITFAEDTLILVEPCDQANSDDFIIAKLTDSNTNVFRQLKHDESKEPYLKALNASFPVNFDKFQILGKIIFSGTFFN